MSEIMSFGNLVNALSSVRDDYNQHLKSVPQYEAFLLVESSTQRVIETLQGHGHSPTPSMAAEVISSLEIAKTKFKEHLKSVPEYRALLAIDRLISDVSIDLGVQPAAAAAVPPKVEPEAPHEIAPTQPEPVLAAAAADHASAQPEAAQIAAPDQVAAPEPEPDLAVSATGHGIAQPEVAETISPHEVAATEPEPDLAASAAEHTIMRPEAAEVASPYRAAATAPGPDVAISAALQAIMQTHTSLQTAAGEITATRSAPEPHHQHATDAGLDEEIAAAIHKIVEPPAEPLDEGSERAA